MDYTLQRRQPSNGAVTALVILKDRQASSYIGQIVGFPNEPMELVWGHWTPPEADNDPVYRPPRSYA